MFAHAPGEHTHGNDRWALLGHDENIHPAYLAQASARCRVEPGDRVPADDVDYQYDGSMSARYDPQYEVDCTVIDAVFFDEDSDTRDDFRPDLYYGAIRLAGATSGTAACREITTAVTARAGAGGRVRALPSGREHP